MNYTVPIPAPDPRRGMNVTKLVRVEMVFVAVFFTGEKVVFDVVYGGLSDEDFITIASLNAWDVAGFG